MVVGGVQIDFEIGRNGRILASSPDLPGLRVSGRNLDEVEAELPVAVRILREDYIAFRSPQE